MWQQKSAQKLSDKKHSSAFQLNNMTSLKDETDRQKSVKWNATKTHIKKDSNENRLGVAYKYLHKHHLCIVKLVKI